MRRGGLRTRLARVEHRLRPEKRFKPVFFCIFEDEAPTSSITGIKCVPGGEIIRKRGEPLIALLARAPARSRVIVAQYRQGTMCGDQ